MEMETLRLDSAGLAGSCGGTYSSLTTLDPFMTEPHFTHTVLVEFARGSRGCLLHGPTRRGTDITVAKLILGDQGRLDWSRTRQGRWTLSHIVFGE